ncbi:MAG: ABC transporter permease [Bacteroidetes bacterium]|nr:ABC transporter permease [Bacteroidota bacterium]
MIIKTLKTLKNFKRNPMLLFVNLPGLTIALSAFLLLIIYVKHETSYDQHFANKDRVVRLYNTLIESNSSTTYPLCLRDAYAKTPLHVPEIEEAAQLYKSGNPPISYNKNDFENQELFYVDAEFFDVFGLDLIAGDKSEALKSTQTAVLTKTLANKIFGNKNCLGKTIKIDNSDYVITGIIEDLPTTTHFQFDILVSLSTMRPEQFNSLEFYTYYLLKENSDFETTNQKIAAFNDELINARFKSNFLSSKSAIEHLTKLHMHTLCDFDLSSKGNLTHIYISIFLAAFILLIAIINYINLFVLSGEKRLLEIGIRKVNGASQFSLRKLFYNETALLTLIAFIAAFFIVKATIGTFGQLMGLKLGLASIINPVSLALIFVFLGLLIFVVGSYPAIYLSRMNIIYAIKGGVKSIKRNKWLSIITVLVQFSISIFLIVSLLIVNAQIRHLKSTPLGFNADNIICISGLNRTISKNGKTISDEIAKLPFVQKVATSTHRMGGGCSGQGLYLYGESKENVKMINQYRIQAGFCDILELELESGRFYNGSIEDKTSIILNQAAVKMMGLKNPIGTSVVMHSSPLKVIGVVKDFYYNENTGEPIAPLALTAFTDYANVFYIKVIDDLSRDQEKQLADILIGFSPDYTYHIYQLSNTYQRKFQKEDRILHLLFSGTALAIFLSFIGMYALSAFSVEKRVKEIGVRKVLGSSSKQVLIKILSNTVKWVLLSMPLSFLLSYIIMSRWLSTFANRIDLTFTYFFLGGILALVIAVVAISIKSLGAANSNPVDCLKNE